jgi:hypothetical protein
MSKTRKLEDVSDRAIEAPYTFYLPSAELIAQFQVGGLVKLIFQDEIEYAWSFPNEQFEERPSGD